MATGVLMLVYLSIFVLLVAGYWRIFTKAGQPGWAAIIPIYNTYVLLKVVGRPSWWLILFFIPVVNIAIDLIVSLELATSFRRGSGFGVGVWLLPWIFVPILGLGSASYDGPVRAPGQPRLLRADRRGSADRGTGAREVGGQTAS